MKSSRIAAFGGAAALALCGLAHAAGPAPTPDPSEALASGAGAQRMAAVQVPAVVLAQAPALRADAVQVAVNTFDGTSPAARAAAADGDALPQESVSSYLLSATRYVQDVGTFSGAAEAAPKKISDAPLPGALWLFGSALLAFLAISVRRRF